MDEVLRLREKLRTLLEAEEVNEAKVTATRGRLLREIKSEMDSTRDREVKALLRRMYRSEILEHQKQLDKRLSAAKRSKGSILQQVPAEMEMKLRKAENEIRYVREASIFDDKKDGVKNATGDVISAAGTIIKIPVFGAVRIVKRVIPKVGKIVLFPLRLPGYLWSKFVEPDEKYEGSIVTSMGKKLAKVTDEMLTNLENTIRRI